MRLAEADADTDDYGNGKEFHQHTPWVHDHMLIIVHVVATKGVELP